MNQESGSRADGCLPAKFRDDVLTKFRLVVDDVEPSLVFVFRHLWVNDFANPVADPLSKVVIVCVGLAGVDPLEFVGPEHVSELFHVKTILLPQVDSAAKKALKSQSSTS